MKKQQLKEKIDPQIIYHKNRKRLIEQNKQLSSEIFKLQDKISAILTKNLSSEFQQKDQDQKFSQKHKELTKNQINEIKKLRTKILFIKNAVKPQQKQEMRQALNELIFLKRQKQKYQFQKQALIKKKHLKSTGLQLNKPLQQQLIKTSKLYKSIQHQNFQLKSHILKLQKQIKNYHQIKQLSKIPLSKESKQIHTEIQIKDTQHQINKIQTQIKNIEKQWQPRIESLNTEYFLLKEIKQEKIQSINQIEKTLIHCKNRVLAMKEEDKIAQDKNRLSKIIVSPEKRSEIQLIYEAERQKNLFFQQFRNGIQHQTKLLQKKQQKQKKSKSKSPELRTQQKNLIQTEPIKLFESRIKSKKESNNYRSTNQRILQQNQFSAIKQQVQEKQIISLKQYASVAIGTTFYYNEQEQNIN